jgi:DMSO/TMAO reductase YedYZ molybdopterin-dependent catalytic subunit
MTDPQRSRDPLVVVKRAPFNAETPPWALEQTPTPTDNFYVRSHFPVPSIAPEAWRLRIEGAVARPLALSLADVQAAPAREIPAVLECAGNDRLGMAPLPPGEPWGGGAVSLGVWRGALLRDLLAPAGMADAAVELLFEGADGGGSNPEAAAYLRSLPRDVALSDNVLLAYELNGAPLPPAHGGPVRLLVAGWYGMAAVKWLTRIEALERPFVGFFQTDRYVIVGAPGEPPQPLGAMRVKARITAPAPGAVVPMGPLRITGVAWSGAGPVRAVEVSATGGGPWQPARLLEDGGPFAWRRWTLDWTPPAPGRYALRARATDAGGATQPEGPVWNALGYANNAIAPVVIDVEA